MPISENKKKRRNLQVSDECSSITYSLQPLHRQFSELNAFFFHFPRRNAIAVIAAPITHEISSEIKIQELLPPGRSGVRVIHEIRYASGTRIRIVVTIEMIIGVTVSPAPLMTPDTDWVYAIATYPIIRIFSM